MNGQTDGQTRTDRQTESSLATARSNIVIRALKIKANVHVHVVVSECTVFYHCTPCPEKRCHFILLVTLRNANRFSKFSYYHTLQ